MLKTLLRLDPDEQKPYPGPNNRLLERPIIRRAPTHPTRRSRRSRTAAALIPLLLLLASLVLRSSCSDRGHRARVAVPREQKQRRVLGGPRVTLSDTHSGGWSRLQTVRCCSCLRGATGSPCFPSPSPSSTLRHGLASQISLFRIFWGSEAVWFGRNPCGEVNSPIDDGRSHESHTFGGICQLHQSPEYRLVRVQRSLAHAMVIAGAVADVQCQASGLPWSTIVRGPFDPQLRECEHCKRAMCARSAQILSEPSVLGP